MKMDGVSKRHWNLRASIVAGLLVAAVALIPLLGSRTVAQTPSRMGSNIGDRYLFSDLAEQVIPSVVTVYVKRDMRKEMDPQTLERLKEFQKQYQVDPFLRQLIPFHVPGDQDENEDNGNNLATPDDSEQWITKGSGSGVIVSADGYVVTNWHVVGDKKNKPEIRVVLSDNTELSGKDVQLVESSQLADLALLKINRRGLKPIPFGDSEKLRIGEWVAAIGSPLDLRLTVTQGIICAKHREIDSAAGLGSMLQTDAVINPGSSGGALVNLDGQLIGINRLITTPFQGREAWSGYGFAIPSNDVKQFVDTVLKNGGKITYGYIGVGVANDFQDSPKLREALGLDKDQKGALVIKVTPGTPAADAGMQEGDMIVAGDGKPITSYSDLIGTVARRPVGSSLKLTVLRPQENAKPREVTVNVRVAERPSEDALDKIQRGEKIAPQPKPQAREENNLGVQVEPYNNSGRQGVKITEVQPGSPAARAGLQQDDVIYEINFRPIKTAQDINKALKGRTDQPHLIRYLRDGNPGLVAIDQSALGKNGRRKR